MQVSLKNRYLLNFQIGELCKELIDLGLEKDKKYTDKRAYSVYTDRPDATWVTPWIGLSNAIWQDLGYAKNPDGSDIECGRGMTSDNDFVSESVSASRPEVRVITRYNPKKGTLKALAYDNALGKALRVVIDPSYAKKNTAQNFHTKSSHVLYCILEKVYSNDEAAEQRAAIQDAMANGDNEAAMYALLRLTDNAYRRIITLSPQDDAFIPLEDVGNGTQIPKLALEAVVNAKIKVTHGKLTKVGTVKKRAVTIDYDKYDRHVQYPEGLPVVTEQMGGWTPTLEGKQIIEEYEMSANDPHARVTNFLLEGGNGTGKTAITRNDVAFAFKCTWHRQQLSGDLSKEDTAGTYYPVAHEGASQKVKDFLASMPDVVEAQLDPAGAYKRLTGKDNPNATQAQVLALINEQYKLFMKEHKEESSQGIELKFVPSPTLLANEEAKKYGCAVLCLDEITRAPQEIITIYNGFLEPGGGMQTPNGWVQRDPNLIVIGCANPPETNIYCKEMDESLRQRFQTFYEVALPSTEKMAEMLLGYEYINDPVLADAMADVISTAYESMEANAIVGAVSIRNLIEWGRAVSYGWSVEKALRAKVIQAITPNKESQKIIEKALSDNTSISNWFK